jgi:hypothetical protein
MTVMSAAEDTVGMVEYPMIADLAPFQTPPFIVYAPGHGIIASDGKSPVLNWFDLEGRLTRRIKLDMPPDPITSHERAQIQDDANRRLDEASNEQRRRAIRERMRISIPESKAFWSDGAVDMYGYIWARPPWSLWYVDDFQSLLRVFSPEGEYLGRTSLPPFNGDMSDFDLSRGRLILRYQARDTGEPVVEVFEVASAIGGFDYP